MPRKSAKRRGGCLPQIPGLKLVDLPETEVCCGAAGTYNLTEPEMSARLSRRKLANIFSTGASVVLTANAGCLLQIAREARQPRRTPVGRPSDGPAGSELSGRGVRGRSPGVGVGHASRRAIAIGELGKAGLVHFRTTAGFTFKRWELYTGYDYRKVGSVHFDGPVAGVQFRF